jgi:hypothetical protein
VKLYSVLFAVLGLMDTSMAADAPVTKMRDGALFYDGTITKEGVANVIALYEAQPNKPTLVIVRSMGGNGEAGLALGEFIYKFALSVRVQNYCLSSCANYVFTAGKTKYLSKPSVVAWHGSAIQKQWRVSGTDQVIYCDSDESCSAAAAKAAVEAIPECRAAKNGDENCARLEASTKSGLSKLQARQHAFFKSVGVDETVTVYGQSVKCDCMWTFSIDDMRKFNIRNVIQDKPRFLESSFGEYSRGRAVMRNVKTLQLP